MMTFNIIIINIISIVIVIISLLLSLEYSPGAPNALYHVILSPKDSWHPLMLAMGSVGSLAVGGSR